jgi:hypothetical protein
LHVNGVHDVTQTETVPEPRAIEVEVAIENLKRCTSPGTDEKFQQT